MTLLRQILVGEQPTMTWLATLTVRRWVHCIADLINCPPQHQTNGQIPWNKLTVGCAKHFSKFIFKNSKSIFEDIK